MKNTVNNSQLFFILFLLVESFSVLTIPKSLAKSSGTGSWITILLTAFVFMIGATIIVILGNMYQGMSLFEYSQKLVGKPITYLFAGIYIVYFFIIVSTLSRFGSEIIKSNILFKTPIWGISFLIISVSCFGASKGITNIGRTLTIFGFIYIVLNIFVYSLGFTEGDYRNLMPLYDPTEVNQYFSGTLPIISAFLGFEVMTVITFTHKNGFKAVKTVVSAIFVVALFYIISTEFTYSILGVNDVKFYQDPLVAAIRRVDIPFLQIMKRMDLFFIVTWLMGISSSLSILLFTANDYVSKIITKPQKNLLLVIVCSLVYITSVSIPSFELNLKIFDITANKLGFIPAFIIPAILFIVGKVRKFEEAH